MMKPVFAETFYIQLVILVKYIFALHFYLNILPFTLKLGQRFMVQWIW